ncbi:hypothetical protein ACWDTT_10400 [Streptosporangium sandarakinum]
MKFIPNPEPGTYLPAIHKGQDLTGEVIGGYKDSSGAVVGGYKVLGRSGTRRYSERQIVPVWRVECLGCGREFDKGKPTILRTTYGCHNCAHKAMSGNKHARWRGGEHVPAYFLAKCKRVLGRRSRTLEWSITPQYLDDLWVAQEGRCAYTGWPLQFGRTGLLAQEQTASLDRIDSNQGYVPGNVQFVHKDINIMKWNHSEERFFELCRAVVEYRKAPLENDHPER